jgi:hypothetical protein
MWPVYALSLLVLSARCAVLLESVPDVPRGWRVGDKKLSDDTLVHLNVALSVCTRQRHYYPTRFPDAHADKIRFLTDSIRTSISSSRNLRRSRHRAAPGMANIRIWTVKPPCLRRLQTQRARSRPG